MEVSVRKCESPDFPKKPRSVDLNSVSADKPRGLERKFSVHKSSKGWKRHKSSTFEIKHSPSDGPRRKRSRKEASLSSFGPAIIKKRRNGLNLWGLNPNGFSSGVSKPEKLSNSSSSSDGPCSFDSDAALDSLKRNNNGSLCIGNCGSSSGLSDGVIVPKKPRGVLRQRKLDKLDDTTKSKDDDDPSAKTGAELFVNDLSTVVASSSQVLEGLRKTESLVAKNELSLDVASSSQESDDNKNECTDCKDVLFTPVAFPSQVSDSKRKKKSADVKNKPSTDLASPSQLSVGKKKKKPSDIRDELSADLLSPSLASIGRRKKNSADARNELSADVVLPSQLSVVKRKKKPTAVKEKGSGRFSSVISTKGEKNRPYRKKNSKALVREDHHENGAPLTDNSQELYGDLLEDDLEQNAARMLSSRFDPSCTGISGSRAHSSERANASHGNFEASQPESSSVDAAGRMLRPRRRNGKSLVRKRRHFYEVNYRDMDPYCLLKQRIRVFWPLDQSWYFGLVKDYDPVTKLHYVKYDDRDEEWINLQNERFKLLLFPSEIAGKFDSGRSQLELKQEEGVKISLDDSFSNCTESEPIIAWFARSKHRRKLSVANLIKKRGTSVSLKLQGHSKLFPKLEEASPVSRSSPCVNDRELSFVYFRKKFHKRREGLDRTLEHDTVHGSSAGSINILASVADSVEVLEELDIFDLSMELKQVMLKLSFHGLCIHDLVFGLHASLCHALFLIQFGKLVNMWPMVHMEVVLVDSIPGLRLLWFEGSLRCAAVLLCLIISSFCRPSKGSKFEDMQRPFTSIGINLSGLHDQGGKLLFLLYGFVEVKSSKWRYVEDKLKQHCMRVSEISAHQCTYSAIKNLQNESGHMLFSSVSNGAVSFEDFPERFYSDILHQHIPDKTVHLNVNPIICYIDENSGRLPPPLLSFATAPSSILSLHIKLLMERNAACVGFQKHASSAYQKSPDSHDKSTVHGCFPVEEASDQVSDITMENSGSSLGQVAASSGKLSIGHLKVDTDAFSVSNDGDWMRSSNNYLRSVVNTSENSVGHWNMELNGSNETVGKVERFQSHAGSWQDGEKSSSSFPEGYSSPEKSEGGYNSYVNNINVQPQSVGKVEEQVIEKGTLAADSAPGLAWEMNGYSSLNPTAPRSMRNCNGHNSVSPKRGHYSKLWQEDFMWNGFNSGSKKPRTQVSYSLPFGGFDLGSKRRSHQRKPRSYKKITTDNAKKLLGVSANSPSYHQRLTCNGNVLVTDGDKGWRECGAEVVIESDDKDSRVCVKFSGITKYEYKAQHVLQPGITNRHTHAMMWKVGKDWTLEFTDWKQWSIFKELHEECFNRNIRAAYVKYIPIPGVRLITDDVDDDVVGMPFVHSSKYYRQGGREVDMSLDPARVLYDMDSDDEEWVSNTRNSMDINGHGVSEVTDDMFERVMDIFEKFAYAQQCNEFSSNEIEEFMDDVGPLDVIRTIYEYWRQKRLKKGMPLIRQFQPALWVRYQQQLSEWDSAMSKMPSLPDGSREKECPIKKPPMYAFCLRPRGLEVPNKLSKQRSHKKFVSTANHSSFGREQDGFYSSGRRTNGLGDEKISVCIPIPSYESSDSYHSYDGPERYPELYRSNSKKRGFFPSPRDSQITPFSQNKKPKRNGIDARGSGMFEPPSMSQIQRDGLRRHRADIDEFKLRDASSAAQHASKMAKMKREKAQWLMHKADLAIHKATVALMIAEAMKESKEDVMNEDEDEKDADDEVDI